MSAEILREAAALMRKRAEVARAGRWVATGDEVSAIWNDGPRYVTTCDSMGGTLNAQHIASWPPAVALAVAAWLDMTAGQVANYGPNMDSPWTKPHEQMALAVTRAYLGESRTPNDRR